MTAAALFLSTFALVFFLGLQSLVVHSGHRLAAFANSFASGIEIAAYLCGGPFGIVAAMELYRRIKR